MSELQKKYQSKTKPTWCPGCGNFAILDTLQTVLVKKELPPHRVIVVTDIGQASKLPHYMNVNTFNGLHGRSIAAATGVKLAAPDMTVVVHAGDGGAYGEGGNHLLHAIRCNIDITVVVHDNHFYGLTKGQASPTTPSDTKTRIQPHGVSIKPLNPLALAISQECSFVGQGCAAHKDHLADLIGKAIDHKGFSLINALQTCVIYDKVFTFKYYQEHCKEIGEDHDPTDKYTALKLIDKKQDDQAIPIGVVYTSEGETLDEILHKKNATPLRDREIDPLRAAGLFDKLG